MDAPRHQPREMCHVDQQKSADIVRDRTKPREVYDARISAAAGDDQFGTALPSQPLHLVEIDARIVAADAVSDGIEPFARQIWPRPMSQVAAGRKRHSEDGVTRLEQRDKDRLVSLRARMWLHIGELALEQAFGAIDGESLDDIDKFAPSIRSEEHTSELQSLRHV